MFFLLLLVWSELAHRLAWYRLDFFKGIYSRRKVASTFCRAESANYVLPYARWSSLYRNRNITAYSSFRYSGRGVWPASYRRLVFYLCSRSRAARQHLSMYTLNIRSLLYPPAYRTFSLIRCMSLSRYVRGVSLALHDL